MRNNDPLFWPDLSSSQHLKMAMDRNYSDCINILQTQWYQADLDQRFVMGDQDLWGLIFPGVATYRRKIFNFNLINATIQMVTGYQRRNRKSTICIPVQKQYQKSADQITKCLYHVHKNGGYQVYSDAFESGALAQGLGFVSIYKDLSKDPISGDICLRYVDMKSCLFDPYFRRHDMMDARFFWTRHFLDREEAAIMHPEQADAILALPKGTYRDDKFYYMPEVYQIQFPNLIAFDEYWYLSSREATYLLDPETQECREWRGKNDEDLSNALMFAKRTTGKRIKIIKKPKPTVRRTILLNDRPLVDEPNPYKIDRYPIVPSLAYFTPDSPYFSYKFRGLTRDLRDAQYLFNRRKVADLDILESQQQGLKIKKGALVTPDDSLNQGNGRILTIDPSFQMTDVEPMQIIPPNPTMLQMEEMLQATMSRISGVNETLLGTDISDKAGIISMMRNSAGITTLTRLFDQFDEMQRICGEIITEMIQQNWTYGKVKQVIGEEPSPEFDSKLFMDYGCKVIQGSLTETQQQLELAQILDLQERFPQVVQAEDVIDLMQIQNKDEFKQRLAARQEAANKQQQQMAELQMEQLRIDNETKLSYSRSQDSLAQERKAKISTDIAVAEEKIRRSKEEETAAVLNLVKALKEIQHMDTDHLKSKLEMLHSINEINFDGIEHERQVQAQERQAATQNTAA